MKILHIALLSLLILCLIINCKKMSNISDKETIIINTINFDTKIPFLLKKYSNAEIKHLTVLDDDFIHEIKVRGLYINGSSDLLKRIYVQIYHSLTEQGYYPFLTISVKDNEDHNINPEDISAYIINQIHRLAVIKSNDKYDILLLKKTNGINYDISTHDIINTLKKWEKKYALNFRIVSVTETAFSIELLTIPEDLENFIDETIVFCPDIYESQSLELRSKYETETKDGWLVLEKSGLLGLVKDTMELGFWWD